MPTYMNQFTKKHNFKKSPNKVKSQSEFPSPPTHSTRQIQIMTKIRIEKIVIAKIHVRVSRSTRSKANLA